MRVPSLPLRARAWVNACVGVCGVVGVLRARACAASLGSALPMVDESSVCSAPAIEDARARTHDAPTRIMFLDSAKCRGREKLGKGAAKRAGKKNKQLRGKGK